MGKVLAAELPQRSNAPTEQEYVERINTTYAKGEEARLETGRLLIEWQEQMGLPRTADGRLTNASGKLWREWIEANMDFAYSTCSDLMQIARAKDPAARLSQKRETQRASSKRRRDRQVAQHGDPSAGADLNEVATEKMDKWEAATYPIEIQDWIATYAAWPQRTRNKAKEALFSQFVRKGK